LTPEALRATAKKMAHSLGISLYINEGRIHQVGPGERIDPPKLKDPSGHARFMLAAAAKP
jgi:hypothetical protein